jgi:hypothetical protein
MAEDKRMPVVITGKKDKNDSTLTISLPDPKIDRVTFLNAGLRLHSMRKFLSPFSISEDHDASGLKYDVFLRHMIGIKSLHMGGARLDFVRTTSAIFLVHEDPAMPDVLKRALPDLVTGRRYVLSDGKERICLCRFTGAEFECIESHAREATDLSSLRQRIGGCVPVAAEDGFDAAGFSGGIRWAGGFNDETDRFHYIIDHEDGNTYTVYVNLNPDEREENPLVFVGRNNGDTIYLYRVEVIG